MSINPIIQRIPNVEATKNNEVAQPELFMFCRDSVNQNAGLSGEVKSKMLYKISFSNSKAELKAICSVLSFFQTGHELINTENVVGYEISFTKDFLSEDTIRLSEKLKLFKSHLPVTFLINKNQEWRVKELFESLFNENTRTDFHRNEMIRTLMHGLILFSQRLVCVDTGCDLILYDDFIHPKIKSQNT